MALTFEANGVTGSGRTLTKAMVDDMVLKVRKIRTLDVVRTRFLTRHPPVLEYPAVPLDLHLPFPKSNRWVDDPRFAYTGMPIIKPHPIFDLSVERTGPQNAADDEVDAMAERVASIQQQWIDETLLAAMCGKERQGSPATLSVMHGENLMFETPLRILEHHLTRPVREHKKARS